MQERKYTRHALSAAFGDLTSEECASLRADLQTRGQDTEAVAIGDQIIDGWHRKKACDELRIECRVRQWGTLPTDGDDPGKFVAAQHVQHRHMTDLRRAMAAAGYASLPRGRPVDKGAPDAPLYSVEELAEMFQIRERLVQYGRSVRAGGTAELVDACEGKLPEFKGAKLTPQRVGEFAKLPQDAQTAVLEAARQPDARPLDVLMDCAITDARHTQAAADNRLAETNGETSDVGYMDPCWRFKDEKGRIVPERHYRTMPVEDPLYNPDLPDDHPEKHMDMVHYRPDGVRLMKDMFGKNAIFFTWCTDHNLHCGDLDKLCAYLGAERLPTPIIWDKGQPNGSGWFVQHQHECCWIAIKGKWPRPSPGTAPASVQRFPRGEHSAKPREFYGLIEKMTSGDGIRRVEFFNRDGAPPGWTTYGDQSAQEEETRHAA